MNVTLSTGTANPVRVKVKRLDRLRLMPDGRIDIRPIVFVKRAL